MKRKAFLKESIAELEKARIGVVINMEFHEEHGPDKADHLFELEKNRKSLENIDKKLEFLKRKYKECQE